MGGAAATHPAAVAGRPWGPRAPASGPIAVGRDGAIVPGTVIADRYRLVAEVGRDRSADAVLWKARDTTLERDVAVTLLVGGWQADVRASSALSRATRSAHFSHRHAARVLDVVQPGSSRLPAGVLGAAVAEWTPGRDLAELVAGGPLSPSAALRVVEPLAQAVADAHRAGLVLGIDHPQRVRVTARAAARLAFPMPRGDATVDDDVRGLGSTLYLLLTARWPVTDGSAPAGLKAAPRTASGATVPVRDLRPGLPVGLAALVDRTLDAAGGIRTAAAVHGLVRQLREGAEDDGVLLPLTEDGVQLDDDPGTVWQPDDDEAPEEHDAATQPQAAHRGDAAGRRGPRDRRVRGVPGGVAGRRRTVLGPAAGDPHLRRARAGAAPRPASAPPTLPRPRPSRPVRCSSRASPCTTRRATRTTPAASGGRRTTTPGPPGRPRTTTSSSPTQARHRAHDDVPGAREGLPGVVRSPSPGTRIEIRAAAAPDVPLAQTQLLGAGTVSGDHHDDPGAGHARPDRQPPGLDHRPRAVRRRPVLEQDRRGHGGRRELTGAGFPEPHPGRTARV